MTRDTSADVGHLFTTFAATTLAGKGAVVTGSASGIGRAIAIAYATAGADVVITDVNEEGLDETASLIESQAGRAPAAVIVADLAGEPAEPVIGGAAAVLPALTTLVNCAGIARGNPGEETIEGWERVLRIDLHAPYLLSRAAWPHMRKAGGGSIVNIASIIARRTYRNRADALAYPAAKSGLIAFTRAMAYAYGTDGIRANSISPGFIRTPLGAPLAAKADELTPQGKGIPVGRVGEPADVAALAIFFASDASSYLTGVDVPVDGGMTLEVPMDKFFP